MNLLLFLLSLIFANHAPTAQTTDDSNSTNTITHHQPKGKGSTKGHGDYIIGYDYP